MKQTNRSSRVYGFPHIVLSVSEVISFCLRFHLCCLRISSLCVFFLSILSFRFRLANEYISRQTQSNDSFTMPHIRNSFRCGSDCLPFLLSRYALECLALSCDNCIVLTLKYDKCVEKLRQFFSSLKSCNFLGRIVLAFRSDAGLNKTTFQKPCRTRSASQK